MAAAASTQKDVGRTLRGARRRHHTLLEDAADITRIPKRYLEALESNAPLDTYPAPMYARAFLREYATYLDLDPGPLLSRFGGAAPEEVRLSAIRDVVAPPRRWPARALLAISICSLVGLAGLGIASGRNDLPIGAPSRPGSHPAPAASHGSPGGPSGTKGPASGITVGVHVLGRSWVGAVADGTTLTNRLFLAGWHRFTAKQTLQLTLGNAGGVRLMVDRKPYPTGAVGQVLHLSIAFSNGHVHVTRV